MKSLVFLLVIGCAAGCAAGCDARAKGGDGKALFEQSCARCHGVDGRGDPIQKERLGVPDMTDPAWQAARDDAFIAHTVVEGSKSRKMPAFGPFFDEAQLDAITAYVRTLRR